MASKSLVIFSLIVIIVCVSCEEDDPIRDKRTIDFVLRSVADVFGYDVQKRPTVLPPPPPQPAKPTFFPPPVAPLPQPNPPPKAPANPPPPQPAPAVPNNPPPPNNAPPPPPPPKNAPPPPPPPKNPPPPPPPKNPPPPPPQKNPPPRPVVRVAPPQPPITPPPLLTETVRKTFNINFNWGRNVQPQNPPPAPAQPPKAPSPPPASPPQPPPAPPKAPPQPPSPPPQPPASPPPSPPQSPPQNPPSSKWAKPQLYEYYDYQENPKQPYNQYDYEEQRETQPLYAPYPSKLPQETVDSYGNKATPYTYTPMATQDPQNPDQDHSKDRFKESIKTFWENSPWTVQNGYKYITNDEENQTNYPEKLVIYEVEKYPDQEEEYRQDLAQYDELQGNEKEMHKRQDANQFEKEMEEYDQIVRSMEKEDKQEEEPEEVAQYEEYEIVENKDGDKIEKYVKQNNQIPEDYYKGDPQPTYVRHEHEISEEDFYKMPIDFESFGKKYEAPKKKKIKNPKKFVVEESKKSQIIQPLFTGVLSTKSEDLGVENKQSAWDVPYEMEYSGSEKKRKIKKPKTNRVYRQADFGSEYNYEPESYNEDFTYTIPEPTTENYEKYEKGDYKTDDDKEDEEEFSKNARITTKQTGKKYTILKKDPTETVRTA